MLEIRCTHSNGAGECGRFLARLEGGTLEIYCPKCKEYHPVAIVDLVRQTVTEIPPNGKNKPIDTQRLLW